MLVDAGTITKEQLTRALLEQAGTGRRLGEVLVDIGALGERDFLKALSSQLGIPLVDLRTATPEPEALARIPETMVRAARVLPVAIDDGALWIAFSTEPMDALLDELNETAGMPIRAQLALSEEIERAVNRSYDALGGIDQLPVAVHDRRVDAFEGRHRARCGRRQRPGRPGRHAHHHAGRPLARVRHPHRAAGHAGARALPRRRRAAQRDDPAGRDRSGARQPHQDHGRHEHRRAPASAGRAARGDGRRPRARRPGRHRRDDLG